MKHSKTPSSHPTQTEPCSFPGLAIKKQISPVCFHRGEKHLQSWQQFLFLQTTFSQGAAHRDGAQGGKSDRSIRSPPGSWGGSHATARSCPLRSFCFRADRFSPRHCPWAPALLHPGWAKAAGLGRVVEVLKSTAAQIWSLKYVGQSYFGRILVAQTMEEQVAFNIALQL